MDSDWTEGPKQGERRTTVEEGTQFKGALTSNCPIDVRGRIDGDVEAPSLSVSASGSVHGRAKVDSLESQGELSGDFEAERVILAGVVKDNTVIRARAMEVRLASTKGRMQVIFGECELEVGDVPRVDEQPEEHLTAHSSDAVPAIAEVGGDAPTEEDDVTEDDDTDAELQPEGLGGPRRKKRRKDKQARGGDDLGAAPQLSAWSSPPAAAGGNSHSEPPPAMS